MENADDQAVLNNINVGSDNSGGVAGRDLVVNHNYVKGRKLSREERIDLNNMVGQLRDIGEDGRATWKFLHSIFGINNIEEMCIEHLQPSKVVLGLMVEKAELVKKSKLMVSREEFIAIKNENDRLKVSVVAPKPTAAPETPTSPTKKDWHNLGLKIALAVATLLAALAAYKTIDLGRELKGVTAQVIQCVYEDNSYSVGSVITDANKIQRECVTIGSLTKWQRAGLDHRANK